MICTSCNSVYAPSDKELGRVTTLAGLCEKCGTKPHFLPFAFAYIEGATGGLVLLAFVLFIFLSGSAKAIGVLTVSVMVACVAMYAYARKSSIVRYMSERERKDDTWLHRVLGVVFGLGTSAAVFVIILTTGL